MSQRSEAGAPTAAARAAPDAVIEALWLVAIVLVPLTFGPPESFAFADVPKVALTRLLAVLIAAVWAVDIAISVSTAGIGAMADWRGGCPAGSGPTRRGGRSSPRRSCWS